MKKKVKGFTLIECIVALAILGIASLTMAQIYAGVSLRNRNNHNVNTSLSQQMQDVEKYTGDKTVEIPYSGTFSSGSPSGNYVEVTKLKADGTVSNEKYTYPVDMYVLNSRDSSDNIAANEKDYDLRYKYFQGH